MANKSSTVDKYITSAPPAARDHLRRLRAILQDVAPHAEQTIKWNIPFFVEPRFLFAFSAHKSHMSFAPTPAVIEAFRNELKPYQSTKGLLKIPYDEEIPEDLVRRMAKYRLENIGDGEGFW